MGLWHIFFALPATNGPLLAEVKLGRILGSGSGSGNATGSSGGRSIGRSVAMAIVLVVLACIGKVHFV